MPDQISRTYYSDFPKNIHTLFDWIKDDGEDKHLAHYKAVLTIAMNFGSRTYGQGYKHTGSHITDEAFKRAFNGLMLGYHRDEVFGVKEREAGEVKRDPYIKYFEQGWNRLHANNVSDES